MSLQDLILATPSPGAWTRAATKWLGPPTFHSITLAPRLINSATTGRFVSHGDAEETQSTWHPQLAPASRIQNARKHGSCKRLSSRFWLSDRQSRSVLIDLGHLAATGCHPRRVFRTRRLRVSIAINHRPNFHQPFTGPARDRYPTGMLLNRAASLRKMIALPSTLLSLLHWFWTLKWRSRAWTRIATGVLAHGALMRKSKELHGRIDQPCP